mmetsp:Transcript_12728/g.23720  ORF Transcript_12728/g.23720 Transcript_12728/m.23720 type:complete len:181 (+) Transcript_12728:133-675(+)|eukprot:CAMPEP_0204918910 /NCGR_PEP_ID=MMETSP1397-20131031/16513_1 /ASSEMBLY_ACC=CAM_ASM_000891 /TAXON_ID=49980 /ORGANISM="Climacostomum Climacostomum virens, Strain Stock W-24" /LENGTH=180 /DNA_ID=CAMNT_0052092441 /DNA_START=137 /DNA_END=679 /DNA_ORIENTATION=-
MTKTRWWVLFESYKSNQLAFTYFFVFLTQRFAIISIIVMIDNPKIQVASILFALAAKNLYTLLVRPHLKRAELFITGIFDLSELGIVTVAGLGLYFNSSTFDRFFDTFCAVVIFGAQFASFAVACIALAEKIKKLKKGKAVKIEDSATSTCADKEDFSWANDTKIATEAPSQTTAPKLTT